MVTWLNAFLQQYLVIKIHHPEFYVQNAASSRKNYNIINLICSLDLKELHMQRETLSPL